MSPQLTNRSLVVVPEVMARPAYNTPVSEPGFGTTLRRIGGDTGTPIPVIGGSWHSDSRHGYSRRNPWNCDGTLAYIEQRGGTPSKMILDGKTWLPILGCTGNFKSCTEVRWHPTQRTVMVGYNKTAREIVVFDALNDNLIKRISVPFIWQSSNGGFMGEGSLSDDGSMVCLGDESNNVCLVDITNGKVSPMQKVAFIRSPAGALGNITVSPLSTPAGGRVVAKMSNTPELVHVYDFGADLMLRSRFESNLTLSHGDVGLTPGGREVFCGGSRTWFGAPGAFNPADGRIAAIDLENREILNISAGTKQLGGEKEAADQHCSLRGPKGWVLTTYAGAQETSGQFLMELVAWKLDGSRECVRFGVTRTNETGFYRGEAHGVMRPDGKAVMFASNWQWAANPKGASSETKSFVYELDGVIIQPPPPQARYWVNSAATYVPNGAIEDRATGRLVPLPDVARLLNGGR